MKEGVSTHKNFARPPFVGIAKVCLPTDITRSTFVDYCYRKNTVNLMMESGTMAKDCYVSSNVMSKIKFPESYKKLGSTIVFVTEVNGQSPIVIAVIDDLANRVNLNEESFHLHKKVAANSVDVFGKGEGELFINIKGDTSILKINVEGDNSAIELNCDGKTIVTSEGEVELNSFSKITQNYVNGDGEKEVSVEISESGFIYEDLDGNKFEVSKTDGTIKMFEGSEPLVKGTTLQTQLNQNNTYLSSLVSALTTALTTVDTTFSSLGVVTGMTATFTTTVNSQSKGSYTDINSEKSFTD